MALIPTTLQTALAQIFNAMNAMPTGGDAYCAEQMAAALKIFILTGQVATVDSGAAPTGSYTGAGLGTLTIDADSLADALESTFNAMYKNDDLAEHLATTIDTTCKADNTVKVTSAGTVVNPAGGTTPFSGPGEGEFTGVKGAIAAALKTCYAAMNTMATGGNDYYAAQLAAALSAYLTTGTVNVTLRPPFVSGSGKGKIA
jgi:hypothetical protein